MRFGFLFTPVILMLAAPAMGETRIENGVRVHRMMPERPAEATPSATGKDNAPKVSTGLDPTFGVLPSCASADWRRSVSRQTWAARCGGDHGRWYDAWVYR